MPGFFDGVMGYARAFFSDPPTIDERRKKVRKVIIKGRYKDALHFFSNNRDDINLSFSPPLDTPTEREKFKDEQHINPLIYAVHEKKPEVVQCLLELGVDPKNSLSFLRRSCVHYAAMDFSCPMELIKYLLEHKARIEDVDSKQKTPSHYAGKYGHAKFLTYLLKEYEYEDTTEDGQGKTTFEIASENGFKHIASKLTKRRKRLSSGLTEKGSVLSLASDTGSVDQDDMELVTGKPRIHRGQMFERSRSLPTLLENSSYSIAGHGATGGDIF